MCHVLSIPTGSLPFSEYEQRRSGWGREAEETWEGGNEKRRGRGDGVHELN